MLPKYITIKDYKLFKNIGNGNFGEVYLAVKKNCSLHFAVKRIDLRLPIIQQNIKYFNNEISIMKKLNHPQIIHLFEFIPSHNHYYLIMEYCNGGNLSNCLKENGKPFSIEIIRYFMRQIVEGLKYIHKHKIIHRDMKLENILLNFKNKEDKLNNNLLNSEIKIIDFGVAIKLGPNGFAETFLGTPDNMDPRILGQFNAQGEQTEKIKYNEKADIWSLGTICYEMYTGKKLFDVNRLDELVERAKLGDYKIPINVELYNEIISFLNSMLQYNEENRLYAEELAEHPFLNKKVNEFTKVDLNLIADKIKDNAISMNFLTTNSTVINAIEKGNIIEEKNKNYTPNNILNNDNLKNNNTKNIKLKNTNYIKNNIYTYNGDNNHYPKENRLNTINNPKENEFNESEMEKLEKIEKIIIEINQKEKMKEIQRQQNIIKLENEEKNNKKENDLIKYINSLLYEYKEAKDYFKENNLVKQEQDANCKYLEIQKVKTALESCNSINNKTIPKPINPEYIYGILTQERNNRFKEVLSKYIKDKKKLEKEIKTKQNSENNIIKLQKIDFIIKELEKKYNNIWVPAPEYEKKLKKYKVEKISYTNCDFNIKIQLKKLDNKKDNINFILSLKINKLKNINKEIIINDQENYFNEWIWTLKYNEWRNIDINDDHNFIISFNIDKNNLYQNSLNKNIQFDISKIINGKKFSLDLGLPTNNNDKTNFNIKIIPIFSKGNKYSSYEVKTYITLKNIFPAFNGIYPYRNNNQLLSFLKP